MTKNGGQNFSKKTNLHLVGEGIQRGNSLLETLSLTSGQDDFVALVSSLEGVSSHNLPVREDTLRESLTGGLRAEISGETEGLLDGKVGLDVVERSTHALLLEVDVTTTTVEARVDSSDGILRALDLDVVDGLEESGASSEHGGVVAATSSGDDLTSSSVDGISVESNIVDVEADSADVLIAHRSLLGGPLEGSNARVLNLVQVLDGLGDIDKKVGTNGVRTEAPDLTGLVDVPLEVVGEVTTASLGIITGVNLTGLNLESKIHVEGLSSHVQAVVLVGRLGEDDLRRSLGDGFTEGDDGLRDDKLDTAVILSKILKANFQMELTSTGDDVLTRLSRRALD